MAKYWDIHKALKTKTIKELAKEMFDYYKNDTEELFKILRATATERDMWENGYRKVFMGTAPGLLLLPDSDKFIRNIAIFSELYSELDVLIRQHL